MEYLKHYKLSAEPFRNDPDGRYYYESEVHERVRLRLHRAIYQYKGLALVIGEPGLGKTTLAYHLFENLPQDRWAVRLVTVIHPSCGEGWLLPRIAQAFGIERQADEPLRIVNAIAERLTELDAAGRHPVVLVDEAQLLADPSACQELRGLLNLSNDGHKSLSLVLFGLPELGEMLRLHPPLAQRVDVRVELRALSRAQARAYITHRLTCSGGRLEILDDEAADALYAYSRGIPRVLNTLADNALFEGFMSGTTRVDASLVAAAAEELGLEAGPFVAGSSLPGPAVARPPPAPPSVQVTEADREEDISTRERLDAPEFLTEDPPKSSSPAPPAQSGAERAAAQTDDADQLDVLFDELQLSDPVPEAAAAAASPTQSPKPSTAPVAAPAPSSDTDDELDALFEDIQVPD